MSEIPDFKQIAQDCLLRPDEDSGYVAEQLRQIWNARGAADLTMLKAEGYISGAYVPDVARAIKKLDR